MTRGCTAESCHFRDLGAEFTALGASRVGISADPVEKQRRFAEANGLDYPLLSDVEGTVARRFGVRRRFGPLPVKRQTFVIGPDRRVIGTVRSETRMDLHADEALHILAARGGGAPGRLAPHGAGPAVHRPRALPREP